MTLRDDTAEDTVENLIERLSDIEHYPEEALAPYEEFMIGGRTYYFTPDGFLYRKDPGARHKKRATVFEIKGLGGFAQKPK